MDDLKLIPTSELLDEIGTRYDEFVFKAYRLNNHSTGNYSELSKLQGNYHICQGLCTQLQIELEERRKQTVTKDNK